MRNKTILISSKCSDLLYLDLYDENGNQLGKIYNGYVPNWLPNKNFQHSGDYIDLEVDIVTGQIMNWVTPNASDLKKTFDYPISNPKVSKPIVKASAQYTKNRKIKDVVIDALNNLPIPKGGVKIKNKIYSNVNDVLDTIQNDKYANDSHTKLKRDASGRFIKMDEIAEFDYPHNGDHQFRVVKIVKESDKYIEGIQVNNGNTGYKRFNKTRASGIYKYKGYVKDAV